MSSTACGRARGPLNGQPGSEAPGLQLDCSWSLGVKHQDCSWSLGVKHQDCSWIAVGLRVARLREKRSSSYSLNLLMNGSRCRNLLSSVGACLSFYICVFVYSKILVFVYFHMSVFLYLTMYIFALYILIYLYLC